MITVIDCNYRNKGFLVMERILEGPGINWAWYCHVTVKDGIAFVSEEYRLHDFDPSQGAGKHPVADGSYRIVEKKFEREFGQPFGPRIAVGIEIYDGGWNSMVYFPLDKEYPRLSIGKKEKITP